MEFYGPTGITLEWTFWHNITNSGIISPLQAAVLKASDTGGLVEQHGISVLQLDTGYTGIRFTVHTCNFTFSSVSWLVG